MQQWAVEDFKRDSNCFVEESYYSNYYMIAFCEALVVFKETGLRFVISGTNVEQGKVLQYHSQIKSKLY